MLRCGATFIRWRIRAGCSKEERAMRQLWALGLMILLVCAQLAPAAEPDARVLPLVREVKDLLTNKTINAGQSETSAAIEDPGELVSIDYDSPTANTSSLSVEILYSDSETGTFAASASDTGPSQTVTNTVTFGTTPASGMDLHCYPAKWAKFKFKNGGGVNMTLTRLSVLREKTGRRTGRPVLKALKSEAIGLDAQAISNGASTSALPATPIDYPGEFESFLWDTTGQAGTRDLEFYYSNAAAGPSVAWEDSTLEAWAYDNKVTSTAKNTVINAKPFKARYAKVKFKNTSGDATTITKITGARRQQLE